MGSLNGYITTATAAGKWNVTNRQVQSLCKRGKIDGAVRFGNAWAIPEAAAKPTRTGEFKPGRKPRAD